MDFAQWVSMLTLSFEEDKGQVCNMSPSFPPVKQDREERGGACLARWKLGVGQGSISSGSRRGFGVPSKDIQH